jgi:hypothetical protein
VSDRAVGPGDADLPRLRESLAGVATSIARLLTRPRYDEAELAELDVRARDLRARIRHAEAALLEQREPELVLSGDGGTRLYSGG